MFGQISVSYFTKWFTIYLHCWWVEDLPFQSPLSAPACCWIPVRLSKHRLYNSLSKHQSNSQTKLSKPTRENFKLSKRTRTRSFS